MKIKDKSRILSEEEIDEIVISQADDDSAWEEPILVNKIKSLSISINAELAERAAFFARLYHEPSIKNWLMRIIKERLDMEEAAFAELKRDLASK